MDDRLGAPPKSGWARLAPEILVENIQASPAFWRDLLGFAIAYQRPEDRFAYLERPDGAQIMLCQRSGDWETGPLERPFGRGVMFQVYVDDVDLLLAASSRTAGRSMPACGKSGAGTAIAKAASASSSCSIPTATWS